MLGNLHFFFFFCFPIVTIMTKILCFTQLHLVFLLYHITPYLISVGTRSKGARSHPSRFLARGAGGVKGIKVVCKNIATTPALVGFCRYV